MTKMIHLHHANINVINSNIKTHTNRTSGTSSTGSTGSAGSCLCIECTTTVVDGP